MANDERWQPIPGWEGLYSASDLGRIRSERRGRILTGYVRPDGRRSVCLTDGVHPRTRLAYHLVLEAFVGPRPPDMEARHLNDNPADDRLSNLAWGTSSENKQDLIRNTGRTSCSKGHQYTAETTRVYRGARHCLICRATPREGTCSRPGCENNVLATGLCSKHYTRKLRHGDPDYVPPPPKVCTIGDCKKKNFGQGMCSMHYSRNYRYGSPHQAGKSRPVDTPIA